LLGPVEARLAFRNLRFALRLLAHRSPFLDMPLWAEWSAPTTLWAPVWVQHNQHSAAQDSEDRPIAGHDRGPARPLYRNHRRASTRAPSFGPLSVQVFQGLIYELMHV
jgi:hypothetical protein